MSIGGIALQAKPLIGYYFGAPLVFQLAPLPGDLVALIALAQSRFAHGRRFGLQGPYWLCFAVCFLTFQQGRCFKASSLDLSYPTARGFTRTSEVFARSFFPYPWTHPVTARPNDYFVVLLGAFRNPFPVLALSWSLPFVCPAGRLTYKGLFEVFPCVPSETRQAAEVTSFSMRWFRGGVLSSRRRCPALDIQLAHSQGLPLIKRPTLANSPNPLH